MRIGIVGGGAAGLATAWLLQHDHEVWLFEKEQRLGGHAHTVEIERGGSRIAVESGFEFFIEDVYPNFQRLLRVLEVPLRQYPMTFTLHTAGSGKTYLLPPVRDGGICWRAFGPRSLAHMLQFELLLRRATEVVANRDRSVTIGDFAARIPLTRSFREQFLFPFLSGGWCVPAAEFCRFAAYDVLKLARLHRAFSLAPRIYSEVVGGTRTYVAAMQLALSRAHITSGAGISFIRRAGDGYAVADARGATREFDHLVLATGAHEACRLLERVPEAGEQRRELARIRYSPTTIAIHGDRRVMPPKTRDWSVFNIRWDGRVSLSTVWKGSGGDAQVFRSWVNGSSSGLAPVYHVATYDHPVVDIEYFHAQQRLGELMGRNNLWFAGVYTYDIDIHESAIQSAIRVARQLAPCSPGLRRLL